MGVRNLLAVLMSARMHVEALTSFQRRGSVSKKQEKATDNSSKSFHSKSETYNWAPSSFQVACLKLAVITFLNSNRDQ
jgi:hypothetical protein